METGEGVWTSEHWRFRAALATSGLARPPAFPGGAWSPAEARLFRVCAARLSAVAGCGFAVDLDSHTRLETALQAVRACLLGRDADCWPGLPCRAAQSTSPVDFSLLIGWGARHLVGALQDRLDRTATLACQVAEAVAARVDQAVRAAAAGGQPAHADRTLTRAIDALRVALSDLEQQQRARVPWARPAGISALVAARAGRGIRLVSERTIGA